MGLAALLTVGALLAGCGGEPLADDDAVAVVEAATAGLDAARIEIDGTVVVDDGERELTGDGQWVRTPRAADLSVAVDATRLHWILAEDRVHLLAADGETWVALSSEQTVEQLGLGAATAVVVDPLAAVEAIVDALDSGTREGEETLDDVDTQHYRVTVAADAYLEAVGAADVAGAGTLEQELWVDDDGRLVRVDLDLGDLGELTVTVTDPDVATTISAPPSGELAR